jgi:hypothetical protein
VEGSLVRSSLKLSEERDVLEELGGMGKVSEPFF